MLSRCSIDSVQTPKMLRFVWLSYATALNIAFIIIVYNPKTLKIGTPKIITAVIRKRDGLVLQWSKFQKCR